MIGLLIRRTLFLIPVLLGGSAIVFTLIHFAPGDPIDALMGVYASPQAREALREKYGLNDPLLVQYFRWLWLVLHGDWGMSIQQRVPVLPLVLEKFKITLMLTVAAAAFAAIVGVGAGILSAVKQNTWIDHLILLLSVFALSMPPYWVGLIAIFIFSVELQWLPTGGLHSFSGERTTLDFLKHLLMPAVVAGLTPAAIIARVTRSAMLEVMNLDFMTALRAKGLGERAIILGHAFRNALPTVVSMTGLQIGYLILGAALFVEIIFSWPGLGLEIYKSVVGRDMPMMLGLVLFSTFVFVVLNLLVDIIYRIVNPQGFERHEVTDLLDTTTLVRIPRRMRGTAGRVLRFARNHRAIVAGAVIVAFVGFVALLAPVLSPYSPTQIHPLDRLKGIGSPGYLLGADQQGRDILSRLMWGARSSLAIAVLPLGFASMLGLLLGSIAGYVGKLPDTLIMRSMDVLFGLPPILLAIAVAATLGPGLVNLVISLTIVLLPPMTRVTYQVVTTLKQQPFVEAAQASGASTRQIIFDQILPNSLAPVIAYAASLAGAMVVFGAGISFIGLGIQPPQADWGRMINDGREVLDLHPHVSTLPGLAIFVLAAGFNFLGDGLRDLLDPRMRM